METTMPLGQRVAEATTFGLGLGTAISALIMILAIAGGSDHAFPGGMSPSLLIPLYILTGGIAGAIVGLLLPLARWTAGAAAVGAVAVAPLMASIAFMIEGPRGILPRQ